MVVRPMRIARQFLALCYCSRCTITHVTSLLISNLSNVVLNVTRLSPWRWVRVIFLREQAKQEAACRGSLYAALVHHEVRPPRQPKLFPYTPPPAHLNANF